MAKKIIGASIGNCVHVAGVVHFLDLARQEGYDVRFLGPAVSIDKLFANIEKEEFDVVAISYRLTPQNVVPLLEEIFERARTLKYQPKWVFGGTKPVSDMARKYPFAFISDGYDDIVDSIRFLREKNDGVQGAVYADNIIERISNSYPYPVIRHHYGEPSLKKTIEGVQKIAEAKVLDVISLGPDQNAQEYFFCPEEMPKGFDGAGGVPIRTEEDLKALKEASKTGNYPLMRCYSGTADVFQYAEMLNTTIQNAWTAIPLCWYNELDGRGTRSIEDSVKEAQELIKWHADRNIAVEINEPHHWALRDAHDTITVAMAYISAYNAKKLGVKHYIAQYMFNVPSGLSFSMDLARVLAMIEMVESLEDEGFKTYRETRAGLPLFVADEGVAKGQLAASTLMQMEVKPHIMHVVAYCEADHAATPEEIIESCKIVKGVIRHTLNDTFSIKSDFKIMERKKELIREAGVLISYIKNEYDEYDDPLANAEVIADCVKRGILDAAHIVKNEKFRGNLHTRMIDGKCLAYDLETDKVLSEAERLQLIPERRNKGGKRISDYRSRPSRNGHGGTSGVKWGTY